MTFRPQSMKARFARKAVFAPSGCLEWSGYRTKDGYGRFWDPTRARMHEAHRTAFELFVGPIQPGKVVMHSCDNPPCVTPAHLSLGDVADNVADMIRKRRDRKRGVKGAANLKAKLTAEEVRDIRRRYAAGGIYQRELAAEYGVAQTAISLIIRNINWKELA